MEKLLPFLRLDKKISEAFAIRDFERCKRTIAIQLKKAEKTKSDWNYWNVIHLKIKGSPQSKTFGPNMKLAKQLLDEGEKEIVLEFLDLCKKFWYKVFSFNKVRKWKNQIRKGEIPDFGGNLIYHLDMHKKGKFAEMI